MLATEIDRRRDAIITFLQDLVRASQRGESSVQQIVVDKARTLGCTVETVRYQPGDVPMMEEFAGNAAIDRTERESVVARLTGTGHGRSIIFFAHPDSERVIGTESWRRDPFAASIENGRLYGWGVADDLAGVAISIQALEAVVESGLRPAGDVIVASTPSKRHARGVSALLHRGLQADAAVYLHPAESGIGMREIKAFASGQLEFRIVIEGSPPPTTEPLQTGFAHLAVSAIDKAFVVWRALKALDERRAATVHHARLHKAVGRSTNIMISYISSGQPDRLAQVGGACVLGGAVSFPPPETLSEVQLQIEAAITDAIRGDSWLSANPPQLIWDSGVTGAEIPTDHPLFQTVAAAITAVTGEPPRINPMHTGSDIRHPMVQKRIPTVGLGPLCGDLSQNGHTDEWVDVEDYVRSVKVAASVIATWCGEL